jgi:hypothetical protein
MSEEIDLLNQLKVSRRNTVTWVRLGDHYKTSDTEKAEACFLAARHLNISDPDIGRKWFQMYVVNRVDMRTPSMSVFRELKRKANTSVAQVLEDISKDDSRIEEQLNVCYNLVTRGIALGEMHD